MRTYGLIGSACWKTEDEDGRLSMTFVVLSQTVELNCNLRPGGVIVATTTSIWITWENQRRNLGMARLVGAQLNVMISNRPRLSRYLTLSVRTVVLILKNRPRNVFCQNPSIVLATLCLLLRSVLRYRLIVDQHNSGLFPLEGNSRPLRLVANIIARRADVALVSNDALAVHVRNLGGKPIVFPDPLPDLSDKPPSKQLADIISSLNPLIVVVCSWAEDEPYEEVLEAAKRLAHEGLELCFTGRPPASLLRGRDVPSNVHLLGFLTLEDYDALMIRADVAVVLTKRQDCLNCGAYEAVSANTPVVLSDTPTIRATFSRGASYTDNTPASIADAITRLLADYEGQVGELIYLQRDLSEKCASAISELNSITEQP